MIYFEPILLLGVHLLVSVLICWLLLLLVFFLAKPKPNSEKNMAYECGFKPFDFLYYPFDVQFYRVGILFLLFDVEIMFLFPWALNFYLISYFGHLMVISFILLLFIGFIYELKVGAIS